MADDVATESVSLSWLAAGWKGDEAVTRAIGDDWLGPGASALLRVPSVITPETYRGLLTQGTPMPGEPLSSASIGHSTIPDYQGLS